MRPLLVGRDLLIPLGDAFFAEDVGELEDLLEVVLAELFVFDFDGGSVLFVHLLLAQEAHSKRHYVFLFFPSSEELGLEALDNKHVQLHSSLLEVLNEPSW